MIGKIGAVNGTNPSNSYGSFPALKHFLLCEGGTGTYEATDAVGGVKFASDDWTATSAHSSYMNVLNELESHNLDLASGTWEQADYKEAIWLICGKFDGVFSFGFGDSTPNNKEIVFSQSANTPFVFYKPKSGDSDTIPDTAGGPSDIGTTLDKDVTSMMGLCVRATADSGTIECFITDTNGTFQSAIEPSRADLYPANFPATYSMGRDVVTSGSSGIVDLSAIAVFVFNDGIPYDYQEAIEWMRTQWAIGHKVIWPAWKGIS